MKREHVVPCLRSAPEYEAGTDASWCACGADDFNAGYEAGAKAERVRIAQHIEAEWEQWLTRSGLPDEIRGLGSRQ